MKLSGLKGFLLIEVIARDVLIILLLLVGFSIDERSFVPPTEHGGDGPFHRGFAAIQLAPVCDKVLLPALPCVQSELLSPRHRVFHLGA